MFFVVLWLYAVSLVSKMARVIGSSLKEWKSNYWNILSWELSAESVEAHKVQPLLKGFDFLMGEYFGLPGRFASSHTLLSNLG